MQVQPSRWLSSLFCGVISGGHAVSITGRLVVTMAPSASPLVTSIFANPSPRCRERSCRRCFSHSFSGAGLCTHRNCVSNRGPTTVACKTVCVASRLGVPSCCGGTRGRNSVAYGCLRGLYRVFCHFNGSGLTVVCLVRGAVAAV